MTALSLILFSLQYFIFELSEFKAKMESSSHTDCKRRIRNIKITKYVMLSIQSLTSLAKMYIEFVEPDPFNTNDVDFNHSGVL